MSPPVVLVVDDDTLVRRLVRTVLEADGFSVVEAADGDEGLRAATTENPDLVVLDVMMPGLDGIEVCRRIDRSVKVLMLTALDDVATEEAGRAAGADEFLVKPFSPVELLRSVEKLVGVR